MISSNPSISAAEEFPEAGWSDEQLVDFFDERFTEDLDRPPWILGSNKTLQRAGGADGEPAYSKWVRFLSAARNRAGEILGRPARAGIDYCLTEVVHCKSTRERGVEAASDHCTDRWLERIVSNSPAPVLVTFGTRARTQVERLADVRLPDLMQGPFELGGRERWIVVMPHPNARGVKKAGLIGTLDRSQREILRSQIMMARRASRSPAG